MGCCFSSSSSSFGEAGDGPEQQHGAQQRQPSRNRKEAPTKHYAKPKWKQDQPVTAARLQAMREEFWDTQPHYGGDRVIWDAIKAACEAEDMATTRLILETAGVIVARPDMAVMYDERGARYALPKYVLSAPTNLLRGEVKQEVQLQPAASR